MSRFTLPMPGVSTPVRFPPIARERLANGLAVWCIAQPSIPAFTAMLILPRGTAHDPTDRPGLVSLTGDLLDEGAGGRDAIELADAMTRMGADLDIETGPDATFVSMRSLSRSLGSALELLADVVVRPHLADADFDRVRELRLSRLRQLSRSAATTADRAFMSAVFGAHPYAHGALGTTAALESMTVAEARDQWALYAPGSATLIIAGDVSARTAHEAAGRAFGSWSRPDAPTAPLAAPNSPSPGALCFVERPGAAQTELRIGHLGPPRRVDAYHALVTLNAVLGGHFTSRINQRLRQEKGVTYGARTSFEFRAVSGVFSCDTSVQANATAEAVGDVLLELERIRQAGSVGPVELDRAKTSLTRGYVRHFETAAQLARGASQLALHELDDDTFDRFVDRVNAVSNDMLEATAVRFVQPETSTVVVVGDPDTCREGIDALGRPVTITVPDF